MALSNAERQAAWKTRRENELTTLRRRVQELEAEVAALKHQVGELGSALAQARAVASERSRARSSRRDLAQHLWSNPRK